MTQDVYTLAAIEMFNAARINRPSATQVKALANDLAAIANDDIPDDYSEEYAAVEAANILRQRIGGFTQLAMYVRCLTAHNLAGRR